MYNAKISFEDGNSLQISKVDYFEEKIMNSKESDSGKKIILSLVLGDFLEEDMIDTFCSDVDRDIKKIEIFDSKNQDSPMITRTKYKVFDGVFTGPRDFNVKDLIGKVNSIISFSRSE